MSDVRIKDIGTGIDKYRPQTGEKVGTDIRAAHVIAFLADENGLLPGENGYIEPSGKALLVDASGKVPGDVGYVGPTVQVGSFPALNKGTDSVTTSEEATTTFGHGVATVDSAGTDEPLSATPLAVKWVIIQAIPGQAGKIALGGSGVDATATTGTGILLEESDSVKFGPCDLADINQDATITGNGVRYTYGV